MTGAPRELSVLARQLRARARLAADLGVSAVPPGADLPPAPAADAGAGTVEGVPVPTASATAAGGTAPDNRDLAAQAETVAACTACTELAEARNNTVFGAGDPDSDLVFLGEAPGAEEDKRGEPFVGRAGKQLDDILSKAMGVTREQVYICNILKCRPPGNRDPKPDEVAACAGHLAAQLGRVRPKVICCLGRVAAQTLLESRTALGRMRGRPHPLPPEGLGALLPDCRVVVTYHPAYLLRNYDKTTRRKVWEDVRLVLDLLGWPDPHAD